MKETKENPCKECKHRKFSCWMIGCTHYGKWQDELERKEDNKDVSNE